MAASGYQKGLRAEFLARLYFNLKGYRVLAERFRTPIGEIDLVVKRGRQLAFVEVKRRGTVVEGLEAVHAKNQQRVGRAAELYLQKHPEYTGYGLRFDVLVLAPYAWPRHIPNAW